MNIFQQTSIAAFFIALCLPLSVSASGGHGHGKEGHDEEKRDVVVMSQDVATASGIKTIAVAAGQIDKLETVYGKITADPASLSHIRARFDGVISNVKVNLGAKVNRGDILATVESNESLKRYQITSPFTGVVIARHANAGELSNGQVLFSIANYDVVWAQLTVFPNQLSSVKSALAVNLSHADFEQISEINYISPSPDGKPYTLAYAKLSNANGHWPVGAVVKGQVVTSTKLVDMVIPKAAIQEIKGKPVVFVQSGDAFRLRPVRVGDVAGNRAEVLGGLQQGEIIVSQNSYLLKADLEKSEAGHAH